MSSDNGLFTCLLYVQRHFRIPALLCDPCGDSGGLSFYEGGNRVLRFHVVSGGDGNVLTYSDGSMDVYLDPSRCRDYGYLCGITDKAFGFSDRKLRRN